MSKLIGEYIAKLRKDKKLSQQQIAKLIGTSQASIQRYESGQVTPSIQILKKISNILEVNLSTIVLQDKNSQICKDVITFNTSNNSSSFQKNINAEIAFLDLCNYWGININVFTDPDDPSLTDTHIISYIDKDNKVQKFKIDYKSFRHLFDSVGTCIQKEILYSKFKDSLE